MLFLATLQVWIKVRDHQLIESIAKNYQGDAEYEVINPSTIWVMVLEATYLAVKGRRMITRKALKASAAPITKQPALPSRLSTIGTMLSSLKFQIRQSNRRSIHRVAMVKSDQPLGSDLENLWSCVRHISGHKMRLT